MSDSPLAAATSQPSTMGPDSVPPAATAPAVTPAPVAVAPPLAPVPAPPESSGPTPAELRSQAEALLAQADSEERAEALAVTVDPVSSEARTSDLLTRLRLEPIAAHVQAIEDWVTAHFEAKTDPTTVGTSTTSDLEPVIVP